MHHYGIPAKFVTLIQQMYENSTCQVIHNGKLSKTFKTSKDRRETGVHPITINFYHGDRLDNERDCQNGIQWTFTKQLDDLNFADNICLLSHLLNSLLSHSHKHIQKKSSKLMQEAEKTGLKINLKKTKLLPDKVEQYTTS